MTKILASALFAVLVGGLAVHTLPAAAIAAATPVQGSFDIAMPASQEPHDQAVLAAAETTGVSR